MKSPSPSSQPSVPGKTQVVHGVVQHLLKGGWKGGDRLTEIEAAERFKVSRTPVREALLELASMGIVELRRNCGAVFLPFGPGELRDLYAVRSLLEVEAARLAATRILPAVVEQLKGAFEDLRRRQRPDIGWQLDRELHAAIACAAGNSRLAGEIARYGDLVQTVREAVGRTLVDIHSTSLADHLRILRHLQQREADAAATAMHRHLEQAAQSAITALERLRTGRNRI